MNMNDLPPSPSLSAIVPSGPSRKPVEKLTVRRAEIGEEGVRHYGGRKIRSFVIQLLECQVMDVQKGIECALKSQRWRLIAREI